MAATKVAVVTGSNKGIGYAIVKGLCERYDGKVYLTSRNEARGMDAVNKLKGLGLSACYHQLDTNDQNSVNRFCAFIRDNEGGIDILVNNAGVMSNDSEENIKTNYFATLRVCQALFPLMRLHGRVVNVASAYGLLSEIPSADLRAKIGDPTLTVDGLSALMNKFLTDYKEGMQVQRGWGDSSYTVSKVGVAALSFIQQRYFDNEKEYRGISVNAIHPGYVATDLTQQGGVLTPDEGARSTLFVALEDHGLYGQFVWSNSQVVDWYGPAPN